MSVSEVPISMPVHDGLTYELPLTYDESRTSWTSRVRSRIAHAETAALRGWFLWSMSLTIVAVGALIFIAEPSVPRWDSPVQLY